MYQHSARSTTSKVVLFIQITMTMSVLYASGSLIFQQETFLDIIMNLPALIFINEIDDYAGTHIMRHINVHHRSLRKSEDFLIFPFVEYHANLSKIVSNALMTFWLIIGTLIVSLNKAKCNIFEDWYHKKWIQNMYFKGSLPAFWQIVDYTQLFLFFLTSAVTYFPILGIYFLKKFVKDKTEKKVEKPKQNDSKNKRFNAPNIMLIGNIQQDL